MSFPVIDGSKYGFKTVAAIVPTIRVGNPIANVDNIISLLNEEKFKNVDFIVFPELCITGYTAADLFFQDTLLQCATNELKRLCDTLNKDNRLIAVGLPVKHNGRLFNVAAVLNHGKVIGLVPKSFIPNYQEFYEKRWFVSGAHIRNSKISLWGYEIPFGVDLLFRHNGEICGVELCEDLWVPSPPSCDISQAGATLIMNLSATDENYGKHKYLISLLKAQSSRCRCVYAYASCGAGESSTDLVFSGNGIIAYNGEIAAQSKRFSRNDCFAVATVDFEKLQNDRKKFSSFYENVGNNDYTIIDSATPLGIENEVTKTDISRIEVDPLPFVPSNEDVMSEKCEEIINIQSWGLEQRMLATGCKQLVIGISGGLDSTLALLIACRAFAKLGFESKNIVAITMPGKATSSRTFKNALEMMKLLGVTSKIIEINPAVDRHFKDIDHDPSLRDAVYENSQARERTQILMDMANKVGGMVLGTGDLSELALGWCTYNGDHMSMYNVNAGVPKTLVKYLVGYFADTTSDGSLRKVLIDIIDTPISPELIPSDTGDDIEQKTEELVGPYELHDFFLFHVLRNGFSPEKIYILATIAFRGKYDNTIIKKWLLTFYRRFFNQQFKRSCMPDGPKIGSVCLSPRGDWRMPSDADSKIWIQSIENV